MNIQLKYKNWLDKAEDPELRKQLISMVRAEISDAFYKNLKFGTGGLRGIMGAGTNRMNIYTVNQATQGLCDFLKSKKGSISVAIAYDSRANSERFAKMAAEVIAGNAGRAYIYSQLMPTPLLSFAVRTLGCDAGIVITASHNPAEYSGYKVYGGDGGQITNQAADAIQRFISSTDIFSGVKTLPFDTAKEEGAIEFISENLSEKYYEQALKCSVNPQVLSESDIKVIYTPLHGAGNIPVRELLTRSGLKNLTTVSEQENPDCLFPTCKIPNPEEQAAFTMAIRLAEKTKADLLIATDPDCDRVGIAVRSADQYTLPTGNEIGCLLMDYILSEKKAKHTLPDDPVIIKTIVTSAMADMIAKEYGARVIDTLTGFKYIGEQIGVLEQMHEEHNYIFGFEESYGYLPEIFVRDKDAISTCMLICEMAAFIRKNGSTIPDELEKLYKKHGFWMHKLLSFNFEGADGMGKMDAIMRSFREGCISEFSGLSIITTEDYLDSGTVNKKAAKNGRQYLPKSDVIVFKLENCCEIAVRPSGTEPKLKCYLTVRSDDRVSSFRMLQALEADIRLKII